MLERRINDAGLPRLKIAEGWISEVLNPLSGQRGPVVEILRLIQPLRFRVVLLDGALVRRTVELASTQVKTIPYGQEVLVVAKQFSDMGTRCVQRLKLADGEKEGRGRGRGREGGGCGGGCEGSRFMLLLLALSSFVLLHVQLTLPLSFSVYLALSPSWPQVSNDENRIQPQTYMYTILGYILSCRPAWAQVRQNFDRR